ncbi:MAG: DNA-directed RNA polymerase subunit omega [Ruminococcaceae bacterium]|nr:DNA-directed RNA polymerase subunit omega [Oscillospiraceae bacterium]
MLNPAIGKLINSCDNRYKLVNQIAKKAREISNEAEQKGEIIIEKPVTIAINQMAEKSEK